MQRRNGSRPSSPVPIRPHHSVQFARRTSTNPVAAVHVHTSHPHRQSHDHPPLSAPPAQGHPFSSITGHGHAGPSRLRPRDDESMGASSDREVVRSRAVTPSITSEHALQKEIDRLTALCDEHERKIRASKNTLEHRLFVEWYNMFTRLASFDQQANDLNDSLQSTVRDAQPLHQTRLAEILSKRKGDVETLRRRLTPWTDFVRHVEDSEPFHGNEGRIKRVDVAGTDESQDALSKIERWAEETQLFFETEIARQKSLVDQRQWRRSMYWRGMMGCLALIPLVVALLVVLRN